MKPGDIVEVVNHSMKGYKWTCGQIGVIMCHDHISDFNIKPGTVEPPPIMPYWWIVQVEHKVAKGGYALAALPEKHMIPHTCTESCPKHLNMEASNQSCAI